MPGDGTGAAQALPQLIPEARRTFFTFIHSAIAAEDPAPSLADVEDEASSAQDNRVDSGRVIENAPEMGQDNHEETD
jgi:hypothetical protein